jgi:hypothetical protein
MADVEVDCSGDGEFECERDGNKGIVGESKDVLDQEGWSTCIFSGGVGNDGDEAEEVNFRAEDEKK